MITMRADRDDWLTWTRCRGPGRWQHKPGCHPRRPRCRWRRAKHEAYETCECGVPHYPHRRGTVDWRAGACVHHPLHERITFEAFSLTDWETGEPLLRHELNPDRYKDLDD